MDLVTSRAMAYAGSRQARIGPFRQYVISRSGIPKQTLSLTQTENVSAHSTQGRHKGVSIKYGRGGTNKSVGGSPNSGDLQSSWAAPNSPGITWVNLGGI